MPATKVQLIGGHFQDSEGNVLVNGYLKMLLSQDETVPSVGNICSGIEITIQLDASGDVVTSPAQSVWGNDVLLPVNSYYKVTGYSAVGQPCWGPNIQQVIGGPTFDVGTWIPNQVISWVNPNSGAISLLTNGTLNASQQRLNLESTDSSITITDLGGGNVNFESASSGAALADYMLGAGGFQLPVTNSSFNVGTHTDLNSRVYFHRFNTAMALSFSKMSFTGGSNLGGGGNVNVALYSDGGNLMFQTGSQNIPNSSSTDVDLTLSPVWAANPGTYILAWALSDAHVELWGWDLSQIMNDSGSSNAWNVVNRNGVVNFGYAANLATGGGGVAAMPSTLGALTAATVAANNNTYTPAIMLQK
jgi:hypothetical protein